MLVNMGFHSINDLLEAEASDLAAVPEIGEAAAQLIVEAVKGEMVRRQAGGGAAGPAV